MRKSIFYLCAAAMLLGSCPGANSEINALTFLGTADADLGTHLLTEVDKITFDGDDVTIHRADGSKKSHAFADVSKFIFTQSSEDVTKLDENTISLSQGIIVNYDATAKVLKITAGSEITNLLVADMSGRKVFHNTPALTECELNVANYNTGVYVLVVTTTAEKKALKFAVK